MITKAYIHEYGNNHLEPEHRDVMEVLASRGIPCELFTTKKLARNQLLLSSTTFVVGNHPTMSSVFKRMGLSPINDSYPQPLEQYLGRKIWTSTIGKLLAQHNLNETAGIFVKPKSKAKLFTGFIIQSAYDLLQLEQFSKETEVYCSTLVNWLSEFRIFVNLCKIVGIKHYAGDSTLTPDIALIEKAIHDLAHSTATTAAYGIDFGVLDNGQTTLIEWNDGFALGSYGLDKTVYTDLLLARWEEILLQQSSIH
jgi:hypothetical protein